MNRYLLSALLLGLTLSVATAVAAPTGKQLTIGATPDPVVFGSSVAFSGHPTGPGRAGKRVQLQADPFPYDGNYRHVTSVDTANNGAWSASDKPQVNTRYRARQGSTTSGVVTELVRIRVSLRLSDRTPAAGRRVRFFRRACPQHDGARVRIQRRTRTGKRRTVRRTRLKDIVGSSCSRYSTRLRVFRDGTFRAFVVSPDGDHANGRSRRRHINAH
jgi:hypothetical protein